MKLHILKYIFLSVLFMTVASCINQEYGIQPPQLNTVSNLQYTLNGDSVKLTWNLPKSNDSLSAFITYNGGSILVKGNPTSYTFGVVQTNVDYMFTVKMQDTKGNLSLGQTVKFNRPGCHPVTNLHAMQNSQGVLLTWKLPNETLTSLTLKYGTQIINLSPTDTSYQVNNLAQGRYLFGIVATNSQNQVSNTVYLNFKVTVKVIGFLGVAADSLSITNPDEKAAATWLFQNFPTARYVSFNAVKAGTVDLNDFSVIWWHYDSTQNLPDIATDPTCVNTFEAYYLNGGAFLLTTYACSYIANLNIALDGKAPNNIFGDSVPWVDPNYPWGISYAGNDNHPLFQGLLTTTDKPYPTAYLLDKGCYRLNHSCVWCFDFGDYLGVQKWRDLTGGIDLASTEWDQNRAHYVTIAEFPSRNGSGKVICIGSGAYDWYCEVSPQGLSSRPNQYLSNIKKLTSNGLNYLKQ
jgi:hypothetical protein